MTTTRERIGKAAERAGWDAHRQGIFDLFTRGRTKITVMYTRTDAVHSAHVTVGENLIPTAMVSATESGKASTVIGLLK